MSQPNRAIRIRQELLMEVPCEMIATSILSVPAWDELNGRRGIVRDRHRACSSKTLPIYDIPKGAKWGYDAHLSRLGLSPDDFLIVIGARNLGNNLRVVAYHNDRGLLQLAGENANEGTRDYYCMCCMVQGTLEFHRLRFTDGCVSQIDGAAVAADDRPILWAISGQPLVSGGATDLGVIIENSADLRHVWRVPVGEGRFGERSQEGEIAEELATTLVATESAEAVMAVASAHGLPRENDYLHSAIGLTSRNSVIIAQLHGSFEMVADRLKNAGATHAIELDEGGSVSTHFVYKRAKQASIADSRILASHYFRGRASSLLVFKMHSQGDRDFVPTEEDSSLGLPAHTS